MKSSRYVKIIIGILLISLMVVSCNKAKESKPAAAAASTDVIKLKLGYSPPDITGVFKTAGDFMELAIADAKKHGIEIEYIARSAASHADLSGQVSAIENFIQSGVNAIAISPADVEAVKPALKRANDLNIPVIMLNMLDEQEGIRVETFVGFDNYVAAAVSGYAMLDALGGPGVLGKGEKLNVPVETEMTLDWWKTQYKDVPKNSIKGKIGIISGVPGVIYTTQRDAGFTDVIKQYPNIKIVSNLPGNWERQPAVTAAENILQSFPDIDAIYAESAEMALGAAIAVKNRGLEGKVMVLSNDGTPESVQAIRDGVLLAETWHGFPEWGWYSVKFATMLYLGEDTPHKYDIRPRTEYAGNADNFYPTPKLEPIDWEAIKAAAKKPASK